MIIKDLEVNKTLDRTALTKAIGGQSFSLAFARKGRNPQTGKEINIAKSTGRNPQTGKEINISRTSLKTYFTI